MARSRIYEVGCGLLIVGAFGVFAVMAIKVGNLGRLFSREVHVTAVFDNVAGIQPDAAVSMAGVVIGTVDGLDIKGGKAVVHMAIEPGKGVDRDAKVRVRMRSLLGEKYIEVVPGVIGGPEVAEGGQLAVSGEQMEIDQLVSRLGPMLEGIDPEAAGRVIKSLADALEKDPERLSRMLDNADRALANGAAASDQLPDVLSEGRLTLAQARTTLTQVDARARQGGELLTHADLVLTDVSAATANLPELADKAEVLLDDGTVLVGSLQARSDQVEIVLDNLKGLDEVAFRRLLREEGILVRLRPAEVDPEAPDEYHPRGRVKP